MYAFSALMLLVGWQEGLWLLLLLLMYVKFFEVRDIKLYPEFLGNSRSLKPHIEQMFAVVCNFLQLVDGRFYF